LVLLHDDEEGSKKSEQGRNFMIRVPNVTLNPTLERDFRTLSNRNEIRLIRDDSDRHYTYTRVQGVYLTMA